MAKSRDSKQFSFRVNFNNPDHLKVYRTLMDLNLDIHKSVSSFVIKALVQYINGVSEDKLTNTGKDRKENLEGYVTRKEIGEMGNCVLCGHNGSRNGIFFTHLNQVEAGDEVKLTDKKGELHRYAVSDTFIVGPYDNYVKKQTGEEILTLITCAERGTKRFICKCVPIEKAGEGDE